MDLDVKKITMTEHAYQRAKERFNMPDRSHALNHFRVTLKLAKKVGQTIVDDGTETILYAHGRTAVYLSLDLKTIITVNKFEYVSYQPIKDKVEALHRKEFKKLERIEKSKIRKLNDIKLKYAIEIAQLNYRQKRTRSNQVREYCESRKKEINIMFAEFEKEISEIQSNKRQIARSMVAVL